MKLACEYELQGSIWVPKRLTDVWLKAFDEILKKKAADYEAKRMAALEKEREET